MKAYKGFNADLTCRGFQYEDGKTYEHDGPASGHSGAATASGREAIAVVTGKDGQARGSLGSWIVLTERDGDWNILEVRAVKVDGKTVKADCYYRLVSGKLEATS